MTVNVLVGTRKGAWIYTSDETRREWSVSKPIMPGWTVYHMAVDTRRATPRIFAAGSHWAWGPMVAKSDDGGETWDQRSPGIAFPEDMTERVGSVWNVRPGRASEPGVVYAGTQPAGLFKSEDWGDTWAPVEELNRHEYRPFWGESGGGDSALHSIELHPTDPQTMYVCIATGGTYVTHDTGKTWALCTHRVLATNKLAKKMEDDFKERYPQFADYQPPVPPGVDPAALNEMHKMRLNPSNPDVLWAQTHVGVFRSGDASGTWDDVTEGLPSFHGFPIGVSRNGEDNAWVVPLAFEADNFRVCDGQFAVYRTTDAGASWQALTEGLPGPDDFQSVYREGMDTDGLPEEGVYVGTTNGQVYASNNRGDSWRRLPGTLPPILSVSVTVV
ncbi:MAG: exo-alpha-sialidase [Dehalococcoidia bacterium]|nr:exo-alpha-sialidase [Dehalococcoidia bacterium]